MKVTVMSDSHDNIWKLSEAMPLLSQADVLLHCGDLISPFMIKRLVEGLGGIPVHMVWGNNDGDKNLLQEIARESGSVTIHGNFASLEIGGKKISMIHYPEIARREAESGKYDLVCYGHDHTAHHEWVGKTLLLNPGELMGMNGRSTFSIYDTESGNVEWVDV